MTWPNSGNQVSVGRCETPLRVFYALNALCATVAVVYFFSWGFAAKGLLDGFYEIQAHSLAQGHLHVVPGPLLAYYHDSSLYMGDCYFYWGYLPALVYLSVESVLGRTASHYLVVAAFVYCFLYFYQRIIGTIVDVAVRPQSGRMSLWRHSSAVLLWGFAFSLPFPREVPHWFFGTFYIYEQAILFGVALAMAACYLMIKGWERRSPVSICASTVLLSLAAWTRPSWFALAACSVPLAIGFAWKIAHGDSRSPGLKRAGVWLAVSLALLAGLLVLNYARFGSFTDFGIGCKMNSASDIALRRSSGFFSPQAQFWVFIFNICSYLGTPDMIPGLGLDARSFTYDTTLPLRATSPSFFYFNPQFLAVVVILPLAFYRLISGKRALIPIAVIMGMAGIYVMLVDTIATPWVAMRYFVEAYYFIIPLSLVALVAVLPGRASITIMLILLAVHTPINIQRFMTTNPNLRLASVDDESRISVDLTCNRDTSLDLYIVDNAVWIGPRLSYDEWSKVTPYNAMGIYEGPGGAILAADVAAVYLVRERPSGVQPVRGLLEVKGLRTLKAKGELRLFVEGEMVGKIQLLPDRELRVAFSVSTKILEKGPIQVMMVFLPDGKRYLPEHVAASPPFQFREISLK